MLELVETMMLSPELSIELGLAILALLFSRMRGENAAQTIVQESPQSEQFINLQGKAMAIWCHIRLNYRSLITLIEFKGITRHLWRFPTVNRRLTYLRATAADTQCILLIA